MTTDHAQIRAILKSGMWDGVWAKQTILNLLVEIEDTPEWMRDLLTELSGIGHGHVVNQESVRRLLGRVPSTHLIDAGLGPFGVAVDEDPANVDHGIRELS